jgi:tRNA (cmo5U34)-methyltransferase
MKGEIMTEFSKTEWAKSGFSREYRDNADIYIMERRRLFDILKSFYRHFLKDGRQVKMLDLGCGDGIITHEILTVDNTVAATLLDGSGDMLAHAQERFKEYRDMRYIKASFQEILADDVLDNNFSFVVSSLAIHHLALEEKNSLFGKIYYCLDAGGYFVNIDVALSPTETLEQWYLLLWKEWIDEKKASLGIKGNYFSDIVRRYKDNRDNKPDTLKDQMNALADIGFKDVDCFYKYGIFTMYGGRK